MGRLIDADILIAELKESALHHCNNPREDSLLQRDRVIVRAQPTVEAIPKEDMIAMFNELLALTEQYEESDLIKVKYIRQFVYDKINSLDAHE